MLLNVNGNYLKIINEKEEKFGIEDSQIKLLQKDDYYIMEVYEKNGTCSKFCGNGAIASLIYLNKNKIKFKIDNDFINVENKGDYFEVEFIVEKIEDFQLPKDINLIFYKENYKKLYEILSYNKALYYAHFINSIDIDNFKKFFSNLESKGIYTSNGEPHLILYLKNNIPDIQKKIYLKLLGIYIQNIKKHNINIILFDGEKIFPFERGVENNFDFGLTKSCLSGSAAASFVFNKKLIKTIDGYIIQFIHNGKIKAIIPSLNINNNIDKDNTSIFDIYIEQIKYVESLYGRSYKDIVKEIIFDKFNIKNYEPKIINTGWHENEFPIDYYKISTYENQKRLEKVLKLDSILFYLDNKSLDESSMKNFPNIKISEGKEAPRILTEIEKIFKNSDNYEDFKNNLKQIFKIYGNLKLEDIKDFLRTIKIELDYEKLSKNEKKELVNFFKKFSNTIILYNKIYKILIKRLKSRYNYYKINFGLFKTFLFKTFQDIVLSEYTKYYDKELSKKLINNEIKLFSEHKEFKKMLGFLEFILKNENLKKIFEKYLENNIKSKAGKDAPLFILRDGKIIYASLNENGIYYHINNKQINIDDYIDKIVNIKRADFLIFYYLITGCLILGSERGLRDNLINALYELGYDDVANFLKLTYLSGDYVGISEYRKLPAGSDFGLTGNILYSVILGNDFIKKELKLYLDNYMLHHDKGIIVDYIKNFIKGQINYENLEEKLKEELKIKQKKLINLIDTDKKDLIGYIENQIEEIKFLIQKLNALKQGNLNYKNILYYLKLLNLNDNNK